MPRLPLNVRDIHQQVGDLIFAAGRRSTGTASQAGTAFGSMKTGMVLDGVPFQMNWLGLAGRRPDSEIAYAAGIPCDSVVTAAPAKLGRFFTVFEEPAKTGGGVIDCFL